MKTNDALELAQTLFEEMGDAAFVIDPQTVRVLDANPVAQWLTAVPRDELLRTTLPDLLRSDADDALAHLLRALHTTQTFHSQEGYHLRRGGVGWTPVNLTVTRLHTEARPLGLILVRDVTEQHRVREQLRQANADLERRVRERTAELGQMNLNLRATADEYRRAADELRASEERFRTFMDHCPAAAWITTADGRVVYQSGTYRRTIRMPVSDPVGKSVFDLYPADVAQGYLDRIRAVAYSGRAAEVTESGVRADGTPGEFLVYRFPLPDHGQKLVGGMAIDVTARKEAAEVQARLEDQLRQAQKMEAVGRLAGGIAHDFNNLLTVINGYTDLLLADAAPADPARESLAEIRAAGERAATLTRQLLAFSRKQILEPKVLNPNAVVADTERMLRRLLGEHVILTTRFDPDAGPVRADPGQVEQILVNLAVNARDAMPAGGRLTVETRNVTLDDAYCRTRPDVAPGGYVLLAVSDTGTGIDADTQPHIFEPFFTTKAAGRGTGLGLATVHGIVKQSGGHVAVYSEVGRGSTFKVYLPRAAAAPPADTPPPDPTALPRGTETILLAEDEAALRALARQVLEGCGYAVVEAADGRDALAAAAAHVGPIHILVSDVVMPHLGGRELAERLAGLRPACRVLFLSGYTDDAVVHHGVRAAEFAFLQKPFTPAALAQKVREVLDAPGP